MYKKVTVLTACVAATALLLAVGTARAEDPADVQARRRCHRERGGYAANLQRPSREAQPDGR